MRHAPLQGAAEPQACSRGNTSGENFRGSGGPGVRGGYTGGMATEPAYLTPYHEAARVHGAGFDATLWANRNTQRIRFEVLAAMGDLAGRRVLDAGCSRGDLAAYLVEQGIDYARYVGLDAVPQVIDFATQRQLPRADFHLGDFVRQPRLLAQGDPQVIVFCGSLNTMRLDTAMAVLEAGWEATAQTLIFNFLSDRAAAEAPKQTGPAHRLNTLVLLDWALQRSDRVAFRQDYLPNGHDATIRLEKR